MSVYINEYIIANNNSMNDNEYNFKKSEKTASFRIKKMLKPLIKLLKQKKSSLKAQDLFICTETEQMDNYYNYQCQCSSPVTSEQSFWSSEDDDNAANEQLEDQIINEINECKDNAAVYICDNDEYYLQPIYRKQQYIPVHFARTEAGTFFWTSTQKPVDADLVESRECCSAYQAPEYQYGDRWVQA